MERRHRTTFTGPIVVIALGCLFLLDNLGHVPAGFWMGFFQLWPLALILTGFELLFRGAPGFVPSAFRFVVVTAVVLAAVLFAWVRTDMSSNTVAVLDHEAPATLSVVTDLGAAELDVRPGDAGTLHVEARGSRPGAAVPVYDETGGAGSLTLRGDEGYNLLPPFNGGGRVAVALPPGVPTTLDVQVGVGDVTLNLAGLDVSSLVYSAGVGNATMSLPDRPGLQVRIDGGVGGVTVHLPMDVPARVEADTGIGGLDVPDDLAEHAGAWESPDYTADQGITVAIKAGIGRIKVTRGGSSVRPPAALRAGENTTARLDLLRCDSYLATTCMATRNPMFVPR